MSESNPQKLVKKKNWLIWTLSTPPKFNIAPENWWLEDDRFLLGMPIFRGELLNFWSVAGDSIRDPLWNPNLEVTLASPPNYKGPRKLHHPKKVTFSQNFHGVVALCVCMYVCIYIYLFMTKYFLRQWRNTVRVLLGGPSNSAGYIFDIDRVDIFVIDRENQALNNSYTPMFVLSYPIESMYIWYIYLHLVDFHGKCR